MSNQRQSNAKSALKIGLIILIVALVIASSVPSVRKWVEEQVLFWKIVYPLIALGAIYAIYDTFRSKAKVITLIRFIAGFIWAGCRSLIIYEILVHPFIGLMSTLGILAFLILGLADKLDDVEIAERP